MSYILDALRKSDQLRHRGAAPTLPTGQSAAPAPGQPAYLHYGLLAAALLGAGMAIGWLRPWQIEQASPAANVVAAKPSEESMRQPAPVRTVIAPALAPVPAPAPTSAPAPAPVRAAPVSAPALAKSQSPTSARNDSPAKPQVAVAAVSKKAPAAPQPPSGAPAAAPAQNVIGLAELPLELQQELPPMTISVHAYSGRPADRMVGINNRMLREGDSVTPGLKLEQITPEGMVFGYKGFSFRRGVK
jgi:general secretion pathway protein B